MYKYKYRGVNKLQKNNDNIDNYNEINIILYNIKNINNNPFLNFLLINDNNKFNILKIRLYKNINNINNYLKTYLEVYFKSIIINDLNFSIKESIKIDGYYNFNENLYCFINIDNIIDNIIININNNFVCVLDEILNKKSVLNYDINREFINFLLYNFDFCIIEDDNKNPYNIPLIAYYYDENKNKINYIYNYGMILDIDTNYSILDIDYENINNKIKKYNSGGFIRYVIIYKDLNEYNLLYSYPLLKKKEDNNDRKKNSGKIIVYNLEQQIQLTKHLYPNF